MLGRGACGAGNGGTTRRVKRLAAAKKYGPVFLKTAGRNRVVTVVVWWCRNLFLTVPTSEEPRADAGGFKPQTRRRPEREKGLAARVAQGAGTRQRIRNNTSLIARAARCHLAVRH